VLRGFRYSASCPSDPIAPESDRSERAEQRDRAYLRLRRGDFKNRPVGQQKRKCQSPALDKHRFPNSQTYTFVYGRLEELRAIQMVCWSRPWMGLMNRTVVRVALVATAICSMVLISFPSFPSTHGIDFKPQPVNRALKGDRPTIAPARKSQPPLERAGKQMPVGCDRAFSSMSSAQFSSLYGRCLA
jgi:hypothetical protein